MSELYPPWAGPGAVFYPPKPFSKAPGVLPPILPLRFGKNRGVALGESYAYPVSPLDPRALGATAWYRADLEWAAALWQDQIDDDPNKDLVQATGGKQPTRTASNAAFGGQSTIDFAGAEEMASIAWATPLAQPSTLFVVASDDGDPAATEFFADGITGGARQELFKSAAATAGYKIAAVTALSSKVAASTAPKIFVAQYNNTQGRVYVSSPTARAVGAVGVEGITGLTVGADETGAANFLIGSVAEVALFRRLLSPNDVRSLLLYASRRYNLPVVS